MKIAFHSNQLSIRGTEVALYDYAHYNEKILGNESLIITKDPSLSSFSHPLGAKKFKSRFKVFFYHDFSEVESYLDQERVDVFYAQKYGDNDGVISQERKSVVHAVFQAYEPHGDVYAYISEWLGTKYNQPYVPYMVDLPAIETNLKKELNIPDYATVIGRHGGLYTFDIDFAHKTIVKIVKRRKDIVFLFLNTAPFYHHDRIIYLEGTHDMTEKVKFINTCDAMLHARRQGESFGLAIAEFSIRNKPIITRINQNIDSAHISMLGDRGIYYSNKYDLYKILLDFTPDDSKDWNAYKDYSPQSVMQKFKEVFLT